jgi:hypothetical protein
MSKCARPGCHTLAKSSCSICNREQYCGSDCQKLDWKIHKPMCPILKRFSKELQPFMIVFSTILEILEPRTKVFNLRFLEHLLSYALHQFGKPVPTIWGYRERVDGDHISNWNVDIIILHEINKRFVQCYGNNKALSTYIVNSKQFPYLERSLSLLNPWLIYLDSDASIQINGMENFDQDTGEFYTLTRSDYIVTVLQELYLAESQMYSITAFRRQYDLAEGHCQRRLAYSRRFDFPGDYRDTKITSIFDALTGYCNLRDLQGDLSGGMVFAEEAYNLVVEAYDPVHSQVQDAAGVLINILIKKGDFYDAHRFAEMTYSNLRDKKNGMDQEGGQMATASYNLALVLYKALTGYSNLKDLDDLVKAEELARDALRIRTLIYGSDELITRGSIELLANILMFQHKFGKETEELCLRVLTNSIRNEGPDCLNAAIGHSNISCYYKYKATRNSLQQPTDEVVRINLQLTRSHMEESLRIFEKVNINICIYVNIYIYI